MISKTSIGIEIAGKDLRLAVVSATFGKMRMVATSEVSGFLDLSVDDQKAALARLVKQLKLTPSRVYLSLPRDKGVIRQLDLPVQVREKLKSVMSLQLENLSPWSVDEVYWDFSHDAPAKGAKTVRVTVAIIPRVTLDGWIEFFKSVKLPLSGASLSSTTVAHGVGVLWPGANPTIVLNCEPGHVEGALIHGSQINVLGQPAGDVTVGAKSAIERLAALGRVPSLDNARLLTYGSAAAELKQEPVLLPLEDAKPESGVRFGAIATALGPLKKSAFRSNLVPPHVRYRRSQLQLIPTYVLIAFTFVLGLLLLSREPYQMMTYASRIDDEVRQIAPTARDVAARQGELNKLSERYRALSTHFQNRDYNLEALREFARVLPPTSWLGNYSYQDGTITVSGTAESATEVQKLLEDSPLFKEVQFTGGVTKDGKERDRFTLKAVIEVAK